NLALRVRGSAAIPKEPAELCKLETSRLGLRAEST
ncbi:MAG: hypothetical protein ACI9A2_003896, partial [Halioglobus sp.]